METAYAHVVLGGEENVVLFIILLEELRRGLRAYGGQPVGVDVPGSLDGVDEEVLPLGLVGVLLDTE